MRRIAALLLICAFMAGVVLPAGGTAAHEGAGLSLSFGFILIAAYLAGDMLSWTGLPKITGYMAAGACAGPYGLNWIALDTVLGLKLLDDLALAFIALAAGGGLALSELRPRLRFIGCAVMLQAVGVFAGIFSVMLLARQWFGFLAEAPMAVVAAAAAVTGVLAIARSPSSAIAVISESRARGPFTETTLGVTVIIDVLVIVLFAVTVALAQTAVGSGAALNLFFLLTVLLELVASIAAGAGLGWLMGHYIRRVGAELPMVILAVAFLVTFFSDHLARFLDQLYEVRFHLEPMLICISAGFYIRNRTSAGAAFIQKMDRLSLPVYVLFFALVGASLNLALLRETWMLAVMLAACRMFFIWASAWMSGRLCGDPPLFARMAGFSYIAQAGVSLGLAAMLAGSFPDWGEAAAVTIVAMISINQIIGPITYKYALDRVGESSAGRQGAG